jgi:glutamine amidotransferase
MFRYLGVECKLLRKPEELGDEKAIILPGVGAFDNGVRKIEPFKEALIKAVIEDKTPFMGICLGMQLLFDKSEEGIMPGFGWISGDVVKFNFSGLELDQKLKIPHMGWNIVKPTDDVTSKVFFPTDARYYFVHSYHARCVHKSDVFARSNYGYDFACAVKKENIWGAQFHPEKSHKFGFHFFKSFLKEVYNA